MRLLDFLPREKEEIELAKSLSHDLYDQSSYNNAWISQEAKQIIIIYIY